MAEYLKDLNGAAAAVRAGYGSKRADQSAYQLLRNSEVAAAVQTGRTAQLEEASITAVAVLERQRRIGFVDTPDVFTDDGILKPFSAWTPEQRSALAGFEVIKKNAAAGDGHIDTVYKFKFWNKNQALDTLCKHLGLLQGDQQPPGAGVPVFIMPADTDIQIK